MTALLTYHSISDKLEDYQFNNDEIWRIIILNNKVYFQSFGSYFIYDGNQVIQRNPPEAILFFLKTSRGILAQGMQSGLFSMRNDSLVFVPGSQVMKNALIRAVVQLGPDKVLLGTSSKGLYLYEISKNRLHPGRLRQTIFSSTHRLIVPLWRQILYCVLGPSEVVWSLLTIRENYCGILIRIMPFPPIRSFICILTFRIIYGQLSTRVWPLLASILPSGIFQLLPKILSLYTRPFNSIIHSI